MNSGENGKNRERFVINYVTNLYMYTQLYLVPHVSTVHRKYRLVL